LPILFAFFLLFASCGKAGDNPPTSKDTLIDFNIPLASINSEKPFSEFNNKLLMIYYMSPLCPHCRDGYGAIQQIAKKYGSKGLASIDIALGNKSDILKFIEEYEASIPFFQDSESAFIKKYGDNTVPKHYLVFPNGKTVLYQHSEDEIKKMVSDIEKFLSKYPTQK